MRQIRSEMVFGTIVLLLTLAIFSSCTSVKQESADKKMDQTIQTQKRNPTQKPTLKKRPRQYFGKASYYHDMFEGRTTANGEIFRQSGMTAAHKFLPFGTIVKVTNQKNGKQVIVKINDRGRMPRVIIDLSKSAAKKLDMIRDGIVPIKLEILSP